MKKKLLSVLLCGVLAVGSLAACGGASDGSGSGDAGTSDGGETAAVQSEDENTLTVQAWDANFNIPALQAAEAAYQKKNPDFKLEILEVSGDGDIKQEITLAGESGDYSNLPDIVLFQDHAIQNFVRNYPDAWSDALNSADINWSDFGEEKLSYSTIEGKHYGAPVDNGTCIFAYRVDLLEQAGYTLDDVTGITWDKFDEIGKKVYETTGKYLLCMDGSGNDLPYEMLQAEGVSHWKDGKPYITDNQTMIEICKVIVKLAQDNVLYLANDWSDYTDQVIQGDMVAGVMNGNWIIPTIEAVDANSGKWEITTMPTLSGAEGYAANGGSSLYITSNCKKADLAADFLAYTFGGGEGSSETYDNSLLNGGVIGTCISASKSDVYNQGVEFFNGQAIYPTIVEYGSHVATVEQNDFHYDLRELVGNAIQQAIEGGNIEELLAQAEQDITFKMESQ